MTKIAIITAMKEEAEHIISEYSLTQTKKLVNLTIYENEKIVLALAGIGKIQAAIATTFLFENYEISKLINIGIVGNLKGNNANIGDVFLVNKISQHDMYLPFDGAHLDYAKKEIVIDNDYNYDFGDQNFNITKNAYCLTGDQFIDDENKVKELYNNCKADIVEMEAFAVASVAREYNNLDKCFFIKAISDGADNTSRDDHMNNLDFAMQNSLVVLQKIIGQ